MKLKLFLMIMGIVFLLLGTNIVSAGIWDDFLKLFSSEKTIDDLINDDVYKELILNDAITKSAIITIKNPMETTDILRENIKVNFIQECGKVNNYKLLINSTCSAERIKEQIFDIKEICYNSTMINNKTFENITTEICNNETYIKKTIYETYTYDCFKEFEKINAGDLRNIKLDADISFDTCKDGSFGYKIDWQFETTFDDGIDKVILDKKEWAWWNSTWELKNHRNFTSTSGDLTNYPVNFSLNTTSLYESGHLRSDCGDIKFVNSTNHILTYWADGCVIDDDNTNTLFRVNTSLINNTLETIYVYYNNSVATHNNTQGGRDTFTLFDDFEDEVAGIWTTESGSINYGSSAQAYSGAQSCLPTTSGGNYFTAPLTAGNIIIEARMRYETSGIYALLGWHGDGSTRFINKVANTDGSISNYVGAGWVDTGLDVNVGSWSSFKIYNIDWSANTQTYEVDGVVAAGLGQQAEIGQTNIIRYGVDPSNTVYYDDILSYQYTYPLPTDSGIGTEEEEEPIIYTLNGTVKDSNNVLVNNAIIIIINQADNTITGTTTSNSTGGWNYTTFNAGTYLIVAYDPNNSTRDGDADPHIVVS